MNLLWVWNELLIALVFLQDDSKKTLMVGITGFQSRYSLDVPVIMAGLTLATLPIVAVYASASASSSAASCRSCQGRRMRKEDRQAEAMSFGARAQGDLIVVSLSARWPGAAGACSMGRLDLLPDVDQDLRRSSGRRCGNGGADYSG